jgi:hypothetical protein
MRGCGGLRAEGTKFLAEKFNNGSAGANVMFQSRKFMCGEHSGMLAVAHKGSAQRKIIVVANLILVCQEQVICSRTSN